jgi:hypothetical protein
MYPLKSLCKDLHMNYDKNEGNKCIVHICFI